MNLLLAWLIMIVGWLSIACVLGYVWGRLGIGDDTMAIFWPLTLPLVLFAYTVEGTRKLVGMAYNNGHTIYTSKQTIIRDQERIIKELETELNDIRPKPTLPAYNKQEVNNILATTMKFAQYEE